MCEKKLLHYNSSRDETSISLIFCPTTLTEHWFYEIEKYLDSSVIKPFIFKNNAKKSEMTDNYNVIIMSFNIVQKFLDIFGDHQFKFCIVDEAHAIKNSKSK